jgi:hypothetical protein
VTAECYSSARLSPPPPVHELKGQGENSFDTPILPSDFHVFELQKEFMGDQEVECSE